MNSMVVQEATTLTAIYQSLDAFQSELKEKSTNLLTNYVQTIIVKEWP